MSPTSPTSTCGPAWPRHHSAPPAPTQLMETSGPGATVRTTRPTRHRLGPGTLSPHSAGPDGPGPRMEVSAIRPSLTSRVLVEVCAGPLEGPASLPRFRPIRLPGDLPQFFWWQLEVTVA